MNNDYKTLEKLKEELKDKFDEFMYKSNIELLTKIDKAIEYIESKEYQYGDEEQDNYDYDIGFDEVNDLLEILRGKDESTTKHIQKEENS